MNIHNEIEQELRQYQSFMVWNIITQCFTIAPYKEVLLEQWGYTVRNQSKEK